VAYTRRYTTFVLDAGYEYRYANGYGAGPDGAARLASRSRGGVPVAFDAKLPRLSQESDTSESMNDDINTLRRILKETRTIAVVGLSANWWRPSYFAAKYLQDHGYRVIPVNPQYQEVLGEKCYPSLRDVPVEVDVVDCFRKSEEIPALADEAIAIGAKVLWMQLGVINDAAAEKASRAGLEVVMDRCMKIEHGRLFGGLNWCGVNTKVISAKRPNYLAY
jgi:uncharacterized protein